MIVLVSKVVTIHILQKYNIRQICGLKSLTKMTKLFYIH